MFDLALSEIDDDRFQTVRINRNKVRQLLARLGRNESIVELGRPGEMELLAAAASLLSMASSNNGIGLQDLGEPTTYERKLQKVKTFKDPEFSRRLNTTIIGVDGFGNVTTSATREDLATIGFEADADHPQYFYVSLGSAGSDNTNCGKPLNTGLSERLELVHDYREVKLGKPLLLFSEEFLQIALNRASFAATHCASLWQRASICGKQEECINHNP